MQRVILSIPVTDDRRWRPSHEAHPFARPVRRGVPGLGHDLDRGQSRHRGRAAGVLRRRAVHGGRGHPARVSPVSGFLGAHSARRLAAADDGHAAADRRDPSLHVLGCAVCHLRACRHPRPRLRAGGIARHGRPAGGGAVQPRVGSGRRARGRGHTGAVRPAGACEQRAREKRGHGDVAGRGRRNRAERVHRRPRRGPRASPAARLSVRPGVGPHHAGRRGRPVGRRTGAGAWGGRGAVRPMGRGGVGELGLPRAVRVAGRLSGLPSARARVGSLARRLLRLRVTGHRRLARCARVRRDGHCYGRAGHGGHALRGVAHPAASRTGSCRPAGSCPPGAAPDAP